MGLFSTGRRRGPCRSEPAEPLDSAALPSLPVRGPRIYRDGTYLISAFGEARTWAVHDRGRWGVVYEWLGQQPVAGWVTPEQIPLEVRARALRRREDAAR
jgi:hypothetical protein